MIYAFTYHRFERLTGPFDSPNTLAVLLATILLLLPLLHKRAINPSLQKAGALLWVAASLMLTHGLAATYSRGGWLAYALGLSGLICVAYYAKGRLSQRLLQPAFALAVILGAMLLLQPAGVDRLQSFADSEDRSIGNRLIVYEGALDVIAQNPWFGVGWNRFADYYQSWLQPLDLPHSYPGALNNYLCLGAELGLPALFCYLTLVWGSIWWACRRAVLGQSPALACLASAQAAFQAAGQFTYTLTLPEIAWLSPFLLVCSWVAGVRQGANSPDLRYAAVVGMGTAFTVCLALFLTGIQMLDYAPTRPGFFSISGSARAVLVTPRDTQRRSVLIYCNDRNQSIATMGRPTLRYLAERNITTLACDSPEGSAFNPPGQIAELIHLAKARFPAQTPIYLLGINPGSRTALAAAAQSNPGTLAGVITIGAPYDWPEPETSPLNNLRKISCPLFLIHSEHNHLVSRDEGFKLKTEAERLGLDVRWWLVPDTSHYFSGTEWHHILDVVIHYIQGQPDTRP